MGVEVAKSDKTIDTIINSWKELGFKENDYNSGNLVGVSKFQFTIKNGVRQSANEAFIRPIREKRPNLFVKTNSRVTKIMIDPKTKRTTGVEFVENDSRTNIQKLYAKKEVILSAGAIDSPRLLMLSGIGPKKELKELGIQIIKDLPVGENLQEHVATSAITLVEDGPSSLQFEDALEDRKEDVSQWLESRKGPLSVSGLMGVVNFFQSSHEKRPGVADMEIHYINSLVENDETSIYNFISYHNRVTVLPSLIAPKSRGWIKLNKTDPIWGKPLLYVNYFSDPQDLEALAEGTRFTNKFVETEVFKKSGLKVERTPAPKCQHLLFEDARYYDCLVKTFHMSVYHPCCTCKMGPNSDNKTVVNSRLKVHGIKGLRVIDASIMPNVTRGNTNAPSMMIGEKGSDLIKEDWLKENYCVVDSCKM